MNVQEVARWLNVPVSWVYENSEKGALPSYKVGRYRRFVPSEIEHFIESSRTKAVLNAAKGISKPEIARRTKTPLAPQQGANPAGARLNARQRTREHDHGTTIPNRD